MSAHWSCCVTSCPHTEAAASSLICCLWPVLVHDFTPQPFKVFWRTRKRGLRTTGASSTGDFWVIFRCTTFFGQKCFSVQAAVMWDYLTRSWRDFVPMSCVFNSVRFCWQCESWGLVSLVVWFCLFVLFICVHRSAKTLKHSYSEQQCPAGKHLTCTTQPNTHQVHTIMTTALPQSIMGLYGFDLLKNVRQMLKFNWDVWNLEAKSTRWASFHVPLIIPE